MLGSLFGQALFSVTWAAYSGRAGIFFKMFEIIVTSSVRLYYNIQVGG